MPSDMQVVADRLRGRLLRDPVDARRCRAWLEDLRDDGTWADVDYSDNGDWQTFEHLSRLRAITLASAQGQLGHSRSVEAALWWWLRHDPHGGGWWYRELGAPIALGDILLLRGGVTESEREPAARILGRTGWELMTGQNTIWAAHARIRRGVLTGDSGLVADAYARVRDTVRINPGAEGIQPDMSFHQHGPQLYSGGYGHGFTVDTIALVAAAHGTAFAFDAAATGLLADLILDGQQWMIHGDCYDFTVIGRENTRTHENRRKPRELADAIAALLAINPPRHDELTAAQQRLRGDLTAAALTGARYFHCSDYLAVHRAHWSASVKMSSPRTVPTETGNGEGIKNAHLGDGISPWWQLGDEYEQMPPLWDWCQLPGLTASRQPHPWPVLDFGRNTDGTYLTGPGTFAAGVCDGVNACTAMDLDTGELSAKKAWFYLADEFAVLVADVVPGPDAAGSIHTTINQTLRRGSITSSDSGSPSHAQAWVHHDGAGYAGLAGTRIHTSTIRRHGSWHDINVAGPSEEIQADVFSAWADHHGQANQVTAIAYLVRPSITAADMSRYAAEQPVTVLVNNAAIQAVHHHPSNLTQAVFRSPGTLSTPSGLTISVDQPLLLLAQLMGAEVVITVASSAAGPAVTVSLALEPATLAHASVSVRLPAAAEGCQNVTVRVPIPRDTKGP